MSFIGWLKNRLGLGESSSTLDDHDGGADVLTTEEREEPCGHTEVYDEEKTYPKALPKWEVREGYLLVPRVTCDNIVCEQCDEIISQDVHDESALVFKPAFIIDPDVSLEEGVNALGGGNSADDGSVVINRSENPSDEVGDA